MRYTVCCCDHILHETSFADIEQRLSDVRFGSLADIGGGDQLTALFSDRKIAQQSYRAIKQLHIGTQRTTGAASR